MAPLLLGPKGRRRRLPTLHPARPSDGPASVVFTRATPTEGCCLECALPRLATVEDFGGCFSLLGRLRREPLVYLQCLACGSRNQTED
jgi:hypothetical protein